MYMIYMFTYIKCVCVCVCVCVCFVCTIAGIGGDNMTCVFVKLKR